MDGRYQSLPTHHMKSPAITLALAAAFLLTLPGLSAQAQAPSAPPALAQIQQWRGLYGDEKAHTEVYTTDQQWTQMWKRVHTQPPLKLDGDKTGMAVCIFLGARPNTGFKPYIISAIEKDGKIVVSYSSGQPMATDYVAQEVTHPWVAAVIPKTSLPVVFKEI